MIDITICPICETKEPILLHTCLDHSVSLENFMITKCTICELLITTPRPSDDRIGEYYLSESYTSHIDSAKHIIDKIYLIARYFTLQWKLSVVKSNTSSKTKRILDFGCGTGEFLKVSKRKGWDITGVEPSPNARAKASEYVKSDLLPSLDDNSKKNYDVITLWHVLEHVPELDRTIQKLKTRLTNDGTIFIAVPNHTSWDAKNYKQHWAGYDVPRHLWHFSKKNMKILLEKNELKLIKVLPMRLDAFYICLLSEKYRKNGKLTFIGLVHAIFNGFRSNLHAQKDKEYSSLIYVAKK